MALEVGLTPSNNDKKRGGRRTVGRVITPWGRGAFAIWLFFPQSGTLPPDASKPAVLVQEDMQFMPTVLPVQRGAKVDFPNYDSALSTKTHIDRHQTA